jgi:hypothetical protein
METAKEPMWVDRIFAVPRRWSNAEIRRVAPLFGGDVVNVSAWRDEDKEGGRYRDYFTGAASYTLTNWVGHRGVREAAGPGEILLDLEADLPSELHGRFDVVFNHTTLEHVFDVFKAFSNLCALSRDVVIVVVPFLQEHHGFVEGGDYGDYWRFSSHALARLFERNGMEMLYVSANDDRNASCYLVAVGARDAARWRGVLPPPRMPRRLGRGAVRNHPLFRVMAWMRSRSTRADAG